MSDNYEFMKTSETQDVTDYSPYVDKQYNNSSMCYQLLW